MNFLLTATHFETCGLAVIIAMTKLLDVIG